MPLIPRRMGPRSRRPLGGRRPGRRRRPVVVAPVPRRRGVPPPPRGRPRSPRGPRCRRSRSGPTRTTSAPRSISSRVRAVGLGAATNMSNAVGGAVVLRRRAACSSRSTSALSGSEASHRTSATASSRGSGFRSPSGGPAKGSQIWTSRVGSRRRQRIGTSLYHQAVRGRVMRLCAAAAGGDGPRLCGPRRPRQAHRPGPVRRRPPPAASEIRCRRWSRRGSCCSARRRRSASTRPPATRHGGDRSACSGSRHRTDGSWSPPFGDVGSWRWMPRRGEPSGRCGRRVRR